MMAAIARLRNAFRRDVEAIVGGIAQPRFATVASVDETTHSVRVLVQPEGVLSGWIPDGSEVFAGGGYGIVCPLSVGDQVKVSFAHGDADHPVVLARIFSSADPVPESPAIGGCAKPGERLIATPGGAFLHFQADGSVSGGGYLFTWKGPVEIDGPLTVKDAITATGDVTANGISVEKHVHGSHPAGHSPEQEAGKGSAGAAGGEDG